MKKNTLTRKTIFYGNNWTLTFRELIFSIILISIFLEIGMVVSNKIATYVSDEQDILRNSQTISDEKSFLLALETENGNAFVDGTMVFLNPIMYNGELYGITKKVTEEYRMHHRKSGKATVTYYSWDTVDTEFQTSDKADFYSVELYTKNISGFNYKYLDMVKKSSKIRYKYYGVPSIIKCAMFVSLDSNFTNSNIYVHENMTSEELKKEMINSQGGYLIAFWIGWILLMCISIYGFYRIDNDWLED